MSAYSTGWTWKNSPYKGTKLLVHLAMADVVNDQYDFRFFMTNARLADKCNMTRQSVNGALKEMVKDGYLRVVGERSKGIIEYEFVFKNVSSDLTGGVKEFDSSVSKDLTGGVKNSDTELKGNSTDELEEELKVSDVDRVWQAYVDSILVTVPRSHGPRSFDDRRRKLIQNALKDFSVEDLILAVTGWTKSSWHTGENPDGKFYHKLSLILRSADDIERFIGYHDTVKPRDKQEVNHAHRDPETTPRRKLNIQTLSSEPAEDFLDE